MLGKAAAAGAVLPGEKAFVALDPPLTVHLFHDTQLIPAAGEFIFPVLKGFIRIKICKDQGFPFIIKMQLLIGNIVGRRIYGWVQIMVS